MRATLRWRTGHCVSFVDFNVLFAWSPRFLSAVLRLPGVGALLFSKLFFFASVLVVVGVLLSRLFVRFADLVVVISCC